MAKNKDYVPSNNGEFSVFFRNIVDHAAQKCGGPSPEWKHIPGDAQDGLAKAYGEWAAAWEACQKPHTDGQAKELRRVRALSEKTLRAFVTEFIRHSRYVADACCADMKIPRRKKNAALVGAPVVPVRGSLAFPGIGLVEVYNIGPEAQEVPDPRASYGVRIYYGFMSRGKGAVRFPLTKPPATGEDLPHSVFTKKKKHAFDFQGESGNTVYICMRYENSKGGTGPWGPVLSANIP